METPKSYSHIQGWGADLAKANRPAYPKERTPPRLPNPPQGPPEQQKVDITVFHSTERPGITPVFGTSTPPSGLSGLIRRGAFKLSENDIRHWLLLLMADRINMVEGIFSDLARGHVPNLYKEMGVAAELKYNKKGALKKLLVAAAVVGVGAYLLKRRSRTRGTLEMA